MTLSELLKNEQLILNTTCASKDDLIAKLVDRVFATGREFPLPKDELLKTIYMREKIGGTMFPSGLSAPHARLKDYEDFSIAIGLPREAVFHEGLQIRMMTLMITSQSGAPWYLPVLAALTKISRDNEYFSRLCDAEKAEDFISILRERDLELA